MQTCHLEWLGSLGDELLRRQRSVAVYKHGKDKARVQDDRAGEFNYA